MIRIIHTDTQNIEYKSILYALVDQLVGQAVKSDMTRQFEVANMGFDLEITTEQLEQYYITAVGMSCNCNTYSNTAVSSKNCDSPRT